MENLKEKTMAENKIRCANCKNKFIPKNKQHLYCSKKCKQIVENFKAKLNYKPNDFRNKKGYQWLNYKWIPTKIQDLIWKYTGLQEIDSYILSRVNWMRQEEMAKEINTTKNIINGLIIKLMKKGII